MRRLAIVLLCCATAMAQAPAGEARAVVKGLDAGRVFAEGTKFLLAAQEGEGKNQWPYEGVYRVRGEIPIGYRVGGTAIAALALVRAPGYAEDAERREAVKRAVVFVCDGTAHPLMSFAEFDGGYDVRAWGYIYGLHLLAELKRRGMMPEGLGERAEAAAEWYLHGLVETEIPGGAGGWNYARPSGREKAAPASPFMTGPAVQALLEARRAGYTVEDAVIARALDYLEASRAASGAVQYSGKAAGRSRVDRTPGAVGRMCCVEATLVMAGRGSTDRVRGAVDAFLVHWDWLDQRRAKPGTHEGAHQVAPYYFMFAHYHAAQCIELLPEAERGEYREKFSQVLARSRGEDGSWNDRVFARSASYGTSIAMLSLARESITGK